MNATAHILRLISFTHSYLGRLALLVKESFPVKGYNFTVFFAVFAILTLSNMALVSIGLHAQTEISSTLTINTTNGAQTVTGTIDGASAGEGTLAIKDDDNDETAQAATFTGNIGASNKLGAITVGSTSEAGSAVFQGTVAATTISVTSGNADPELSTAEFQNGLSATTVTLDEVNATAIIVFNATNGNQTIDATIVSEITAGEGGISVIDDDASAAPDTITFSGQIGSTDVYTTLTQVGDLTVGNATQGGSAVFTSTNGVSVDTVTVTGGDHSSENSAVEFQDDFTVTSVTLDDNTGTATLTINTTNGAQTIGDWSGNSRLGTFDGASAGEGTLAIKDDDADAAAQTATFIGNIGASNKLGAITVGSTTEAGSATFQGTVAATNITVTGGNHSNETGLAEFQKAMTATTVTLDDNTGAATLTINATNGDQTIAATFDGASAGEGTVAAIDDDANAAPDTITFTGNIGASNKLGAITVGSATQGGEAVFQGTVAATNISVTGGNHSSEDSTAEFQKDVTATTVTLDDNTGAATLTINTTNGAQTVTGTIDGASAGEGTLAIKDDDNDETAQAATFTGNIGASNKLGAITVGSTSEAGSAVFQGTVAATTISVTSGNADPELSTAEFQNGLSATTVTLDEVNATAIIVFNATNGNQTIDATIVSEITAGEGGISVIDDDASAAPDTITFSGQIGSTDVYTTLTQVGDLTVGNATQGGSAVFTSTNGVSVDTVTVTGGDHSSENSAVEFQDDFTVTSVTLDDNTGTATLTINTTNGAQTIGDWSGNSRLGTFDGASAGEGTLAIKDDDADAAAQTATFIGNIGASNKLGAITVGSTTEAGSATFQGTVAATNITVTGGNHSNETGLAEFQKAMTATTVTLDDNTGAATLTINATNGDQTIAATFDGASAGEGTVAAIDDDANAAPDTITFTGNIGASNKLGAITVGSATQGGEAVFQGTVAATNISVTGGNHSSEDSTAEFQKDVTATTITLDDLTGQAKLKVSGSITQTIAAAIQGTTDTDGILQNSNTGGVVAFTGVIGNGGTNEVGLISLDANTSTTFSSAVNTVDLSVGTGSTLNLDGATTVNNDFTVGTSSTIDVAAAVVVKDKLTIGDSSIIVVGSAIVTTGTTPFTVTNAGTAIADNDDSADITVKLPSNFTTGTINLIDDTGTSLASQLDEYIAIDTALVDYTIVAGSDDTIIAVTATPKVGSSTAAELGLTQEEANALINANKAVSTGDKTALSAISSALNTGGATATNTAKQVGPQTDTLGAAGSTLGDVSGKIAAIVFNQLTSHRAGTEYARPISGIKYIGPILANSPDSQPFAQAIWFKLFGVSSDQNSRNNVPGYSSDTAGIATGFDFPLSDASRIGVSYSYASTNVEGDGEGRSRLDIKSSQLSLYGGFESEHYYLEGLIGIALNENERKRFLTFGGLDRTASGSYDTLQYNVTGRAGLPLDIGNNIFFTPNVGFSWTHVEGKQYTETGAGSLNLTVKQENVDVAIGSLGMLLHREGNLGNNQPVTYHIRSDVHYDLAGDEAEATATFTGGGAAFSSRGAEVTRLGFTVGGGLTMDFGKLNFSVSYDAVLKAGYVSHTGAVRAKIRF